MEKQVDDLTLFIEQKINGETVTFGIPVGAAEGGAPAGHTHTTADITDFEERIVEILDEGEIVVTAKSAYQSWLDQPGNAGKTEADFIASLKGPQGPAGPQGPKGDTGEAGPPGTVNGTIGKITAVNGTVCSVAPLSGAASIGNVASISNNPKVNDHVIVITENGVSRLVIVNRFDGTNAFPETFTVKKIIFGYAQSFVILSDDSVFSAGDNTYGQLGRNAETGTPSALNYGKITAIVDGYSNTIVDVAVGKNHTLFLSKYGRVFTSGDNTHGQLGRITTAGWNPQQVSNTIGSNITSIAAGEYHSACLSGSTIYTWGRNDKGQLAHNYSGSTPYKVMPSNVLNAKAVVCGANHTVALDSDGYLWSAGDNTYGQCGGLYAYYWQSTQGASVSTYAGSTFTKRPAGTVSEGAQGSPPDPTYETYDSIACGDDFTVARKGEQIYTFGDNRFGQLGRISNSWGNYNAAYQSRNIAGDCQGAILPAQSSTRFADVVCGSRHALARTNNGRLHSWGDNDCGQLCRSASTGNASTVNSALVMDEAVSLIAAGGDHSGFVKEIGELWTAGKNLSGQLCRTGPTGTGSSPNLEKVM